MIYKPILQIHTVNKATVQFLTIQFRGGQQS